jgi:hypothetical protein
LLFFCQFAQFPEHHPQGYHVRNEKIAPLSLSSFRLSPSAHDFLGFAEDFFVPFSVSLPNKTDEQ